MKKCKTCRWWARDYDADHRGMADCDFIDAIHADGHVEIRVHADDDQGLSTILMTHESFGCIKHEES